MDYPKIDTLFERDKKTFKVTDKIRNPIFNLIKEWEITEKIDGTNIYIEFVDGSTFFVKGRTSKAEVPRPVEDYIKSIVNINKLQEMFDGKHVIIYGEGYGGKIQAGRNDKERSGKYSEIEKFIVFDILVEHRYWLKRSDIEDVCNKLGLDVVPLLDIQIDLTCCWENFRSDGYYYSCLGGVHAEGIIGKTPLPLFDNKGNRIIWKLKNKDL